LLKFSPKFSNILSKSSKYGSQVILFWQLYRKNQYSDNFKK